MAKRRPPRHVAPEEGGEASAATASIGPLLSEARARKGWTLRDLSAATGVAVATLSKVENSKTGTSFDTVVRIAGALGMSLDDMLAPGGAGVAGGRHTVTRAGGGLKFGFSAYDYEIPCNDLVSKAMIPLVMTIRTREPIPRERWQSHPGEEFIYVVAGAVEMRTEHYGPVVLNVGDSAYIDSTMAHAFRSVGDGDARMLSICLARTIGELFGAGTDGTDAPPRVS